MKPRPYMATIAAAAVRRAPGHRWFRYGRWVIASYKAPRWA